MHFRTSSVFYESLVIPPTNHSTNTYVVLKTLLAVVLLIREEGTNPCTNPTEDCNDEGNLNFVVWMNEMIIIDSSEYDDELDQFFSIKQMLRLLFVHDQAFERAGSLLLPSSSGSLRHFPA